MFAVFETVQIKHHAIDDFLPAVLQNAKQTLEGDPNCHQFDVCLNPDRRDEIYLYELYTNRVAFDAHLDSHTFKIFSAYVDPMIAAKTVRTLTRVYP